MNKLSYLLKNRHDLIWWVTESSKATIPDEMTLEAVLNYGSWQEVTEAISILGWSSARQIFDKLIAGRCNNLRPEVSHYFKLYFAQHEKIAH
ncbi:MAG: hypothetical protein A2632_01365 [Candidatus Pacebacteria bacterium RIFCSPHIGHO2_01_FULL_46_16]|nr:MAG: hypothetical protein A2632_01365 [Candidatus Pacebacteria bacterium RIFCSPHIGHO2_01_FULL_46_16]